MKTKRSTSFLCIYTLKDTQMEGSISETMVVINDGALLSGCTSLLISVQSKFSSKESPSHI